MNTNALVLEVINIETDFLAQNKHKTTKAMARPTFYLQKKP